MYSAPDLNHEIDSSVDGFSIDVKFTILQLLNSNGGLQVGSQENIIPVVSGPITRASSISQAFAASIRPHRFWVCHSPCRHRTTNDRRGNGSNKSYAQYSHLGVGVATWMHYPLVQAPIFRLSTLRLSWLRPKKTLHLTVHPFWGIVQDQVSRLVSSTIQG
jgi:hypothetical protein